MSEWRESPSPEGPQSDPGPSLSGARVPNGDTPFLSQPYRGKAVCSPSAYRILQPSGETPGTPLPQRALALCHWVLCRNGEGCPRRERGLEAPCLCPAVPPPTSVQVQGPLYSEATHLGRCWDCQVQPPRANVSIPGGPRPPRAPGHSSDQCRVIPGGRGDTQPGHRCPFGGPTRSTWQTFCWQPACLEDPSPFLARAGAKRTQGHSPSRGLQSGPQRAGVPLTGARDQSNSIPPISDSWFGLCLQGCLTPNR